MDDKDKVIKDAQYRKGLSIAFFNATNAGIELTKVWFESTKIKPSAGELIEQVKSFRDVLLEEHKNYYANVIAQVGTNYKVADTIEKLKKTSSLEELTDVWRSLSADERHDKEIIKAVKELKYNYETAQ